MATYGWDDRLPDHGPLTPQEPNRECNDCGTLFDLDEKWDEPECPDCGSRDIHRA